MDPSLGHPLLPTLTLASALAVLTTYKYAIVFPIAVVEGPMIAVLTGSLASSGTLNPPLTVCLLWLADLVGDTLHYSLGYWGGHRFLRRWGHLAGETDERLLRLEAAFARRGDTWLALGKTHVFGGIVLIAAGVAKMPYLRFLWINAWSTAIKVLLLFSGGYILGSVYSSLDTYLHTLARLSFGFTLLWMSLYFLRRTHST